MATDASMLFIVESISIEAYVCLVELCGFLRQFSNFSNKRW